MSAPVLQRLADKWEGEAANYDRRTDGDFTDYAVMLRYCKVQLESAIVALQEGDTDDDRACDEGKGICDRCKHCFCCHANDQTNCVMDGCSCAEFKPEAR